jgi:DNA-binding NtrC family response regulator
MKKRILIVDDDLAICEALQILLATKYDVDYFDTLNKTREFLENNHRKLDLIILDYNIGNESGIDFYKENIKEKNLNIPAILISGFIVTQLKTKAELNALDKLFVGVFEKPFDFIELKEFIANILAKK